ncbi:hypothetical protein TNCV_3112011 [Trichonephila clavipes]|nr:hypothetical protein TNCV_3112011 [Trichonephila clavipes]
MRVVISRFLQRNSHKDPQLRPPRRPPTVVVGIASMGKLPDLDAFDRGQIVGVRRMKNSISEIVRQLGFSREIGLRVGRNRATVMRMCHRWTQEETTDRWRPSHIPHCTTTCDDRRIVRMAVMDHTATSQAIAQQI